MTVYKGATGFAKLVKKYGVRMDGLVRQTVFDLAEEVIIGKKYSPGTPVDTGFARASWFCHVGSAIPPSPGKAGSPADAVSRVSLAIADGEPGDTFWVLNNAAYIGALEYGHSSQAPRGMVRIAMQNAKFIAEDVAKRLKAGAF